MRTHSPVVRAGETETLCFLSVVSQELELVQVELFIIGLDLA